VRTLCLLVALVLGPPFALAQRALLLDDTPTRADSVAAAQALGWQTRSAQGAAQFERLLEEDGPWDSVVLELRTQLISPRGAALLRAHLEQGGLLTLAFAQLDTQPGLQTLLGVACGANLAGGSWFSTPAGGVDLFQGRATVPSPLPVAPQTGNLGTVCTPMPAAGGQIWARNGSPTGEPLLVSTAAGQVVLLNLAPDLARGLDLNADGRDDMEALYLNVLDWQRGQRPAIHWLVGSEDALPFWRARLGRRLRPIETPAAAALALAQDGPPGLVVVDGPLAELADPAWSAWLLPAPGSPWSVLWSPDWSTPPAWLPAPVTGSGAGPLPRPAQASSVAGWRVLPPGTEAPPSLASGAWWQLTPGAGVPWLSSEDDGPALARGVDRQVRVAGALRAWSAADTTGAWGALTDRVVATLLQPRGSVLVFSEDAPTMARLLDLAADVGLLALPVEDPAALASGLALGPDHVLLDLDTARAAEDDGDWNALWQAWAAWSTPRRGTLLLGSRPLHRLPDPDALPLLALDLRTNPDRVTPDPGDLGGLWNLPRTVLPALPAASVVPIRPLGRALAAVDAHPDIGVFARWSDGGAAGVLLDAADRGQGHVYWWAPGVRAWLALDQDANDEPDVVPLLRNLLERTTAPATLGWWDGASGPPPEAVLAAGRRAGLLPTVLPPQGPEPDADVRIVVAELPGEGPLQTHGAMVRWMENQAPLLATTTLEGSGWRALQEVPSPQTHDGSRQVVPPTPELLTTLSLPEPVGWPVEITGGPALAWPADRPLILRWGRTNGPGAAWDDPIVGNVWLGWSWRDSAGPEPAQVLRNLLSRRLLQPIIRLDTPDRLVEGTRTLVSAAASVDPTGEGLTFAWDLTGDGVFGDATGPQAEVNTDALNGGPLQSLTLGVQVRSRSGRVATARRTLPVVNRPPEVRVAVESLQVGQGSPVTLEATVTDAPADRVVLALWDLDDGTVKEGLRITHTWLLPGLYEARILVEDSQGDSGSAVVQVEVLDLPPVLRVEGPTEALEGETVTLVAIAGDPGGDPFDVTWAFGDGVTATGETVQHTWRDDGAFDVVTEAVQRSRPDLATRVTTRFTVRNVAPVITGTPPDQVDDGSVWTWEPGAVDPGDDTLAWSLPEGPADMTVDVATGALRWQPDGTAYGEIPVRLRVDDGDGGTDERSFTVTVVAVDTDGGGAPDRCELRWAYDPLDAADDASDDDLDGLTLAVECLAGRNPRVFSGPPAPRWRAPAADGDVRLAVFDLVAGAVTTPDGDAVVYDAELRQEEAPDDAPVWTASGRAGDGDEVRIPVSGVFREDAWYLARIRARSEDVTGPWSEPLRIRYNVQNAPPSAVDLVAPEAFVGNLPVTIRWRNAVDPEGDPVTYTVLVYATERWESAAPFVQATEVPQDPSGETTWVLDEVPEDPGPYTVRVRATDEGEPRRSGLFVERVFVVDTLNRPPTLPEPIYPVEGELVRPDRGVTLVWTASEDPDGDEVTYRIELMEEGATVALADETGLTQDPTRSDSAWTWDRPLRPDRTYQWTVRATDGRLTTEPVSAVFVTGQNNRPPTVPVPRAPARGEVRTLGPRARGVTFVWENSTDPDPEETTPFYDVEVSQRSDMNAPLARGRALAQEEGPTTEWTTDLDGTGPMFWRVRASDGRAVSAWSEVVGFELRATQPPDPPGVDAGVSEEDTDLAEGVVRRDAEGCRQSGGGPGGGTTGPGLVVALLLVCRRRPGVAQPQSLV
jgi:hypothetical protein